RLVAATVLAILLAHASPLRAQGVEVSPFIGYLFGNDLFEAFVGPLDVDGAASLGVVVEVPVDPEFRFEAFYSHQAITAVAALGVDRRPALLRIAVDHFQAGGVQE